MLGVKFGNIHTYKNWGLILTKYEITSPEAKTETQEIAGMNGILDLTESITDDVKYKNRTLTFTFSVIDRKRWDALISEIENYIHGRKMQVILDSDKFHYYEGRCSVDSFSTDKAIGTLVIKCDASPYKYETSTGSAWIWDTFSFVNGVILTSNITVNGKIEVTIPNAREVSSPTFVCSSAMQVTFNGVTYALKSGSTKVLDIRFKEGNNKLTFVGYGTVEVRYRGGSL